MMVLRPSSRRRFSYRRRWQERYGDPRRVAQEAVPTHYLPDHIAYCRIVVSVQLDGVCVAVPLALNRITPDASEQNARWPVVPVVTGVAVTVYPSEYP